MGETCTGHTGLEEHSRNYRLLVLWDAKFTRGGIILMIVTITTTSRRALVGPGPVQRASRASLKPISNRPYETGVNTYG